ncbi:4-diphosphocytidyl-2-methyl-D-erythritol synthase [Desulfocurvibacter africanus PCS]|uniref:Bifunctional enzyme IspD/IspF n=1 Tax=Desulfocurvibacter africanus PCS TaxID=1262666 RepID=M5PPA2_DESAF|nr:2-C-methyl-D-erythritol 4-phosphate cytidylyltransferase [Desulfocurvibacter africanus]EMG35755.1 4-diphosphocytidyl-2-methyl-D-erythritol synthase [Desulfocurvibacter africanus PCS]
MILSSHKWGHTWAVLLAAGSGTRLADACGGRRKQFMEFQGLPLFWHSARTFARVVAIKGLVFVFPPEEIEACAAQVRALDAANSLGLPWLAVAGGARRQDSVRNGLAALPRDCGHVLVHDSARPFMSASLVQRICVALEAGAQSVIPALAVTDTIKRVTGGLDGGRVAETLLREELAAVQTPQGFDLALLRQAHERAETEDWQVTDDASLMELAGGEVRVVPGEACNVKITNPEDLRLLEEQAMPEVSVTGFGYDVHRYAHAAENPKQPARPMVLGTVPIPGAPEVLAHSDGDVLLHALTDAVLGCLGKGDIGTHFPDTDKAWDNAASSLLLSEVLLLARREGLRLMHVDLTVIAQVPKLAPHREEIRKSVANLLGLPAAMVNVKATTEEGLGFTGRREGIKAVALVTGLRRLP